MSESLRDQLLKAGFKPSPSAKPKQHVRHKPEPRKPREPAEPDLAKAFALRAQADRAEREAAEREAREKAGEEGTQAQIAGAVGRQGAQSRGSRTGSQLRV